MNPDGALRPLNPNDAGAVLDQAVTLLRECGISFREGLHQFEKRWLEQTYAAAHGNQCVAARELEMHRNTLQRWDDLLGIDRRQFRSKPVYRTRKSSARHGGHEAAAMAANSVRKGGRGESPEPSGAVEADRSSGTSSAAPDEKKSPRSQSLAAEQAAMRERWRA